MAPIKKLHLGKPGSVTNRGGITQKILTVFSFTIYDKKISTLDQCAWFAWWQHTSIAAIYASALQESEKMHFSMQFLM